MVLTFNLPNPIVTTAKAIQMKSTGVLYRVNEIQWFFFKTQYRYGIRLFFSVYWVGVMFRLTGWNKINEILTCLFMLQCSWWLCSAILWLEQTWLGDITKAFYSKAHIVQKNHDIANMDCTQTGSPIHKNKSAVTTTITTKAAWMQNLKPLLGCSEFLAFHKSRKYQKNIF